jgi:hypothetical protein
MYRLSYDSNNLEKSDFIKGIGFNLNLLQILSKKRKDTSTCFWLKEGVSIDGSIRTVGQHPLLGRTLIDNSSETPRKLIVECIYENWYYGTYLSIVYRIDGTNSHGGLDFRNLTCIDESIIQGINKTLKQVQIEGSRWEDFMELPY